MIIIKNNQGIALLLTMLLLGTILATALGIAILVTGEISSTSKVDDSVLAVFAADAGAEKMFYTCSGKIAYPASANFSSVPLGNGATYDVCMAAVSGGTCTNTCNDTWVISKGKFSGSVRSFEASY